MTGNDNIKERVKIIFGEFPPHERIESLEEEFDIEIYDYTDINTVDKAVKFIKSHKS